MKHKLYYQFSGSCLLLLFFFLGYIIKFYQSWIKPFDDFATRIARLSYPAMNGFFLWITKFANPITVIILTIAILFLLIRMKKTAEAIWFSSNLIIVAGILNPLLKLLFGRERPTLLHLVVEKTSSFPSGHAVASMILFGTLIFILPSLIKQHSLRLQLQVILGLLILFIGISRVYLGVHFPSDILAGYALSLSWLLFSYPIFDKHRFTMKFKGKQE